jgi:hypothetical protein
MLSDWLAMRMAQALKVDPYKAVFSEEKGGGGEADVEKGRARC